MPNLNLATDQKTLGRPRYKREDEMVRGCGKDSSGSGHNLMAGSCEHSNEPSSSIKGKVFFTI
jgi:hypothetical protein